MSTAASERFDKIANNFATSEVHLSSPTMKRLHELVVTDSVGAVCDIACGAGHLALSFAGRCSRIVAVDPAPNMLDSVRRLAQERNVNIETVLAPAEAIPLASEEFDIVMSRLAPHHFSDIHLAVQELTRLAKPGGHVAIIDLEGHPDPAIDAFNHQIEVLHDPTHVRSYTAERWRSLFESSGLEIEALEPKQSERAGGVTVKRWCEIASSGDEAEKKIRNALAATNAHVLAELGIVKAEDDYRIPVRTVIIVGRKPK